MVASFAETFEALSEPVAESLLEDITRRLAASAEALDRSAEFPKANFEVLGKEGLIGLTVSRQYGGRNAGAGDCLLDESGRARARALGVSRAARLFRPRAYAGPQPA